MTWVLFLIIWIIILSAGIAGISAAPWVPTRKRELNNLQNVSFKKGGTVIDLGCGDGAVLFALARMRPDLQLIGYDISLLPLFLAYTRKFLHFKTYKTVSIRFGNLFNQNVSQADGLIIFLMASCYKKLLARLKTTIKDDCVIVVEAWRLPNIEPQQTIQQKEVLPLYLYRGNQLR